MEQLVWNGPFSARIIIPSSIWQVLPSHKIFFAAECVFVDFAIAVIFHLVIKSLFFVHIIWVLPHSD